MSSTPLYDQRFRRPVIGFTDLLKKSQGGSFREKDEYAPFMFRALVIAVDVTGGKLETPDGEPEGGLLNVLVQDNRGLPITSYTVKPTKGPRNPKNSVRARIVSGDLDQFIDDDNLRTFWPLFPGLENPSPGELVYVIFEDSHYVHGLWLAKVPNNLPEDNANQILMSEAVRSGDRSINAPDDPQRLTKLYK